MRPAVLFIGSLPPPVHGASLTNELVVRTLSDRFRFLVLDTSEKRGIHLVGRVGKLILDRHKISTTLRSLVGFIRIASRERPSLVYLTPSASPVGALRDFAFLLLSRSAGIPVLLYLHQGGWGRLAGAWPWPVRAAFRVLARGVRIAVVATERQLEGMDRMFPASMARVVPHGLPDLPEPPRRKENPPPKVLFVSNLREEKGYHLLLKAIPLVHAEMPEVEFHFVGPSESETEQTRTAGLMRQIERQAQVVHHGFLEGESKDRVYADAWVFALPTLVPETGPLVVLEAMRAGLPVVTTDRASYVVDGATGIVLREVDERTLARSVVETLRDGARRGRMGIAGRKRFEEAHTLGRFAEGIASAITEALTQDDRPPTRRESLRRPSEEG